MNPSTAQARVLVDELVRNTVSDVVLCPGSRNAPLAMALFDAAARRKLTLHVRIDERSAAFLALGIGARTRRPAVVVCTSGTAAANFHPAVAEADRAGVPLIVLTADRPPALRAAGANQVIEQQRLYGNAVRHFEELAVADESAGQNAYWRTEMCRAWTRSMAPRPGPVHVNIPFDDPLVPDADTTWREPVEGREHGARWTDFRAGGHADDTSAAPETDKGLVVACDAVDEAAEWADEHGWPLVAETGTVGLSAGAWLLANPRFIAAHRPEQIVCFGRPTVFRQVNALLADPAVEVLLADPKGTWPTPGNTVRHIVSTVDAPSKPSDPDWLRAWQEADDAARVAVAGALEPWPNGPAVAKDLLDGLPQRALLVVGSSNPARDIALAPSAPRPDLVIHRNRGVSGIDGTVSTAIGAALAHDGPSYALLGDLTFLHDLNGLLLGPQEERPRLTIVVINDDGGGIFSLLEQGAPEHERAFERVFGTPHGADIGALCGGYGVPHALVTSENTLREALRPPRELNVVEVRIHRGLRRDHHARLRAAVADAIG